MKKPGLDVSTGEIVIYVYHGIIDPFKVENTVALQNGSSAASTLLLTDHAIVEE